MDGDKRESIGVICCVKIAYNLVMYSSVVKV